MPVIIDPTTNTEREVDEATYRRMRQSVETDSRENLITVVGDREDSVALWDCADGTWTSPIPKNLAYQHYLRKLVYKCSSCMFTSIFENDMGTHINSVREQALQHRDAEVVSQMIGDRAMQTCTGCGQAFQARKNQGHRHLEAIQKQTLGHVGTESVFMHRFSLTASEPTVLKTSPLGGVDTEGLRTSTVEQRPERPKRRRRRGRSKGRLE